MIINKYPHTRTHARIHARTIPPYRNPSVFARFLQLGLAVMALHTHVNWRPQSDTAFPSLFKTPTSRLIKRRERCSVLGCDRPIDYVHEINKTYTSSTFPNENVVLMESAMQICTFYVFPVQSIVWIARMRFWLCTLMGVYVRIFFAQLLQHG